MNILPEQPLLIWDVRQNGSSSVLDADIEACFDRIDHVALMDRVRVRVKDKRVCALVKAFLKAGILTELGESLDTSTGTPQGGGATRKVHVVSGSRWLEVG